MADDADFAGDVTEKTKDISVSAIRASLEGDGQDYCEDCGEDLTPARRAAAPWAVRCVPCAGALELKNAHRR